MSGSPMNTMPDNVQILPFDGPSHPPVHTLHNSNEPLPRSHADLQPAEVQQPCDGDLSQEAALRAQGHNDLNSERSSDARAGGVARTGEDILPLGKANILDKVVGKMEKVIGKVTRNADMQETGELREAGGKKAVVGEACALYD